MDWLNADELKPGKELEFLQSLSLEQLKARDQYSWTLLHYLYRFDVASAIKIIIYFAKNGLDLNAVTNDDNTPSHFMVQYNRHEMLEYMCCLGANMNESIICESIMRHASESTKVILANGYRLGNLKTIAKPDIIRFEQGVLRCRDAIVVLLGLKKFRRRIILPKLDRFLISQVLAVEIWTTRHSVEMAEMKMYQK